MCFSTTAIRLDTPDTGHHTENLSAISRLLVSCTVHARFFMDAFPDDAPGNALRSILGAMGGYPVRSCHHAPERRLGVCAAENDAIID